MYNPYYFKTLHIDQIITFNNHIKITDVKLFTNDKLIVICSKPFIYDIKNNRVLCHIYPLDNDKAFEHVIVIEKDKIILFNYTIAVMYLVKKDNIKKVYIFNKLHTLVKYKITDILYVNNKLIFIGEHLFKIYNYNNNNLYLQCKIKSNILKASFLDDSIKGSIFNKKIILIINEHKIEFYDLKKFKLIYNINFFYSLVSSTSKHMQTVCLNNGIIIFGYNDRILLYSFKEKILLEKIINCDSIKSILEFNNSVYVLDEAYISILNIYNYELYNLNKTNYEFNNSLILIDENNIIASYKDKQLLFFKTSYIKTLVKTIFEIFIYLFIFYINNKILKLLFDKSLNFFVLIINIAFSFILWKIIFSNSLGKEIKKDPGAIFGICFLIIYIVLFFLLIVYAFI